MRNRLTTTSTGLFTALFLVVMLLPLASLANDNIWLAERLQRHHEAPVRPEQEQPQQERQQRAPDHAGERGRPDHAGQGERPPHSQAPERPEQARQDRSRESRGERPQYSGSREQIPEPGEGSRWSTHGAPETDTDEDADEASDDDRIYFQRYP